MCVVARLCNNLCPILTFVRCLSLLPYKTKPGCIVRGRPIMQHFVPSLVLRRSSRKLPSDAALRMAAPSCCTLFTLLLYVRSMSFLLETNNQARLHSVRPPDLATSGSISSSMFTVCGSSRNTKTAQAMLQCAWSPDRDLCSFYVF